MIKDNLRMEDPPHVSVYFVSVPNNFPMVSLFPLIICKISVITLGIIKSVNSTLDACLQVLTSDPSNVDMKIILLVYLGLTELSSRKLCFMSMTVLTYVGTQRCRHARTQTILPDQMDLGVFLILSELLFSHCPDWLQPDVALD